ncbi:MAG: hypothetical protein ACKVZJ_03670 [Phycisphaerales bacterium]
MSREITIRLGSRAPKDEDRLLKTVMRTAKHGDVITIDATGSRSSNQGDEEKETVRDEHAETRIAHRTGATLDAKDERLKQQQQVPEPQTDEERKSHAEERAGEIVKARKSLREMATESVVRWGATEILDEAWKALKALWELVP